MLQWVTFNQRCRSRVKHQGFNACNTIAGSSTQKWMVTSWIPGTKIGDLKREQDITKSLPVEGS